MRDVIHKPNAEVFFSFITLFTWYEFCIDYISDDVKKRSHAEYVENQRKIRELTLLSVTKGETNHLLKFWWALDQMLKGGLCCQHGTGLCYQIGDLYLLQHAVVKIVREKYLKTTSFESQEELQTFISELYVFLVDQMHVALNQVGDQ